MNISSCSTVNSFRSSIGNSSRSPTMIFSRSSTGNFSRYSTVNYFINLPEMQHTFLFKLTFSKTTSKINIQEVFWFSPNILVKILSGVSQGFFPTVSSSKNSSSSKNISRTFFAEYFNKSSRNSYCGLFHGTLQKFLQELHLDFLQDLLFEFFREYIQKFFEELF